MVDRGWGLVIGSALVVALAPVAAAAQAAIEVSPGGPVRTLGAALRLVSPGGRIVVRPGTYREPTIVVDRPVEIVGEGRPVFDGEGQRQIIGVSADDVTVRGLRLINVGASFLEDRAAIKVAGARRCVIADNEIDNGFFAIYLAEAQDCRVEDNVLRADLRSEAASGNGIHLWHSEGTVIARNRIAGYRDGIYLEFSHDTQVRDNLSAGNLRYGLHFMYSNDCTYSGNTFRGNGSGVAVMYSQRVTMTGNRFEQNWGGAAYGLLLKEISDSRLDHNVFRHNTTGLLADGANRLVVDRNDFTANGWAVKLEASTEGARFTRNNFVANTFDLATNSRSTTATLADNYWDGYVGYDLNHDGIGDVPYRPVRLFSLLTARDAPALLLLRSAFVGLLDAVERVLPALTPEALQDRTPAMRKWP